MHKPSTIAAIITALGEAAVSIIRISGTDSFAIARKLTTQDFEPGKFKLSWIKDGEDKLDQALVLAFKNPKSFTGEDVIEFHMHGGVWVTQRILELVLEAGATLAKPGEFTERAFLNQKLDLSQAEAISDMIQARTRISGVNAVNLYQGFLGKAIREIRDELIRVMGAVTASIDFPDEVGDYDSTLYEQELSKVLARIDELLAGEQEGHILRNGYKVALIGDPNAGKSSLLNALLKNDRAIVTDIAGTTRDTIEESFSINGVPIVLVDTAGIRESEDVVERIGIDKSKQAIEEADMVLWLQDLTNTNAQDYSESLVDKKSIKIATKLDLAPEADVSSYDVALSVISEDGMQDLKDKVIEGVLSNAASKSLFKINHRQADLLRKSKEAVSISLNSAKNNMAADFWTIDLKAGIEALGEITGDVVTEELLDNIFSSFCIGK